MSREIVGKRMAVSDMVWVIKVPIQCLLKVSI